MSQVRLAIVADIHHGTNHGTKLGEAALPLLGRFRDWCAATTPALAVELGDRINDRDAEHDARLTREVAGAFSGFPAPTVHLLGNHDCFALARAEAEEAFQQGFASHSRDVGGFHLVFWNADTGVHRGRGFVAAQQDLDWLAADLAATKLRTVVFSHVPLDAGSMAGNLYFDENPGLALGGYANARDVQRVLEASGKVVLCIAGHTHWNALNFVDGIPYVTVPSLTDGFMTWPRPAAAWAMCELGDDIVVRVAGEAPVEYRFPTKRVGEHWVNKRKDYAPRPPATDPALRRRYLEALGLADPAERG